VKRLSYIEEARCLKVKIDQPILHPYILSSKIIMLIHSGLTKRGKRLNSLHGHSLLYEHNLTCRLLEQTCLTPDKRITEN